MNKEEEADGVWLAHLPDTCDCAFFLGLPEQKKHCGNPNAAPFAATNY